MKQLQGLCQVCKTRKAEHRHHMFPNYKLHRKLYGFLMDMDENILLVCSICHLNKPIPTLTEIQFCSLLGIKPRSKTGKLIYSRR